MENFNACTDEELVNKIKAATPFALEALLERYRVFVNSIARRYFIVGNSVEDLAQEGLITLSRAVFTYDESKNATFKTYVNVCINRRIYDMIKSASTPSKKVPDDLIYFDSALEENFVAADREQGNPEGRFIENESYVALLDKINFALNPDERTVLKLYLDGISYSEIAARLGVTTKKVDNTLQKIKKSLKKIINS